MDAKELGQRIATARRAAGLTQDDAAKAMPPVEGGKTPKERTWQRWESGETAGALRHLDDIARVVKTSRDALLGIDRPTDERVAALEVQVAALRPILDAVIARLSDAEGLAAEVDRVLAEAPPAPGSRRARVRKARG